MTPSKKWILIITVNLLGSVVMAQEWEVPRTNSGKPDLQGIFTNKTLTPLSRPRELGEIRALSPEQVARMHEERQTYLEAEFADSDRKCSAGYC